MSIGPMISRARSTTAAFVAVAMVTAWSGIARADCKNDAECKGDRVCEKGTCVAPASAPATAAPAPATAAPAPAPRDPASPSPATAAAVPTVEVAIRGADGEAVTLDGLHARETCRAPCTVAVPPGRYTLRTKSRTEEVDITSRSSEVKLTSGCTACVVGGGIALAAGIGTTIAGAVMAGDAAISCARLGTPSSGPTDCFGPTGFDPDRKISQGGDADTGTALLVAGISVAVLGAAALITGLVIGGSKVTVEGSEAASAKRAPSPAPSLGLTSRGVGFSF
jgi:hypothetical protein